MHSAEITVPKAGDKKCTDPSSNRNPATYQDDFEYKSYILFLVVHHDQVPKPCISLKPPVFPLNPTP